MMFSLLETMKLEELYDIATKKSTYYDLCVADKITEIHAMKENGTFTVSNSDLQWYMLKLFADLLIIGQIQGIREERRRRRENLKRTNVTEIIHF